MSRIVVPLLAALLSFSGALGQSTNDTLREVRVKGHKKKNQSADERINTYAPGQKITSIDSVTLQQYQFQSVANLLSQQTPVFIKSYGINALATLSFRGASAAQSQVYWNGVPLQNAALGMSDVSLLPVSLLQCVQVVYGSSAAMWGSGNVGGALVVENEQPYFDTNAKFNHAVSAVAGSFSQYQLGARTSFTSRKWFAAVNIFGQSAQNNFSYNDAGADKRMANAQLSSGTGLLQIGYKPNEQNTVAVTAWYQQYYREIPRALFEAQSLKNQRDESLRLLATWQRTGRVVASAKLSFIRDAMHYRDTLALLNTRNNVNQVYADAVFNYNAGNSHKLMLMLPVSVAWVDSGVVRNTYAQSRYAVAFNYLFTGIRNLQTSVSLRGEVVDDNSYVLPGINAAYALTDWLALKANLQRTYRVPTLNELYYNPGGNRNLQPEKGWSLDGGYAVNTAAKKKIVLHHELSVFNRVIDNWILWFGGAIWTPHNIATVHSRGVETDNKLIITTGRVKWHISINTAYTLSTTIASNIAGDGSIGKQIPYAPRYNGQGNIGFSYRSIYLNYNHTYTGYRFLTVDESQWLMPYNTGNVQLLYTMPLSHYQLQLTGQCNNVFNRGYSVVNARPMPGINWLMGIRLMFN